MRNIFFCAIVLFSIGSLLCAFSSSLDQLVMARVVQGIGGAMMVPVGRLTVMKVAPREQYMSAMAFVTLPGQIGPLLGPALGGMLVQYANWHWIYLINIPVGIPGAVATIMLKPNYTMQTRRFDFPGFIVRIVNLFGYRYTLVVLLFPLVALLGWMWLLPVVLLLQGMVNAIRFSSMNTLTLKELPDELASSGNSLLSMIMQLSISIGVTVAGLLPGAFSHGAVTHNIATPHTSNCDWLYMALVIALPALVFWRIPPSVSKNVDLRSRRKA